MSREKIDRINGWKCVCMNECMYVRMYECMYEWINEYIGEE